MEIQQINETKKELRNRLKQTIRDKKTNRTNGISRKKTQNINNSLKKITEILINRNIETPDQIDNSLIENVMTAISKEDLELILNKMQDNYKFKELLLLISDKINSKPE